ncbi:DUF4230 domain-containing protein [Kitasatospora sp. NPDC085879]|jgi:hypothetical protein|uniref:DUF4230 domain-containing protein n=1 Tax=Kitasatospora sp. NPDC085879 TaxID=3154769 RepID=UPI0034499E0A
MARRSAPERTSEHDEESDTDPSGGGGRAGAARGRLPWYFGLPIALAGVLALLLVTARLDLFPGLPDPFARREVDRSGPAVLKSIQNMSRYTAATGDFQVIVDLDQDARFLPSQLLGKRTLYVAAGSVGAYVDLGALPGGAVTVSEDRRTASVRLPHAKLADATLDVRRSYVFSQQRGLFDRIGDFFSGNPGDQQRLEVLATEKIQTAARDTALTATAETNTTAMLQGLLRSLGFTTVDVTTG